jgi:hypothetical protein
MRSAAGAVPTFGFLSFSIMSSARHPGRAPSGQRTEAAAVLSGRSSAR